MDTTAAEHVWFCEVCLATNPASRHYCDSCWAPRDEASHLGAREAQARQRRRQRGRVRNRAIRRLLVLAGLIVLGVSVGAQAIAPSVPRPGSPVAAASSPGAWTVEGYDAAHSLAPPWDGPIPGRVAWTYSIDGGSVAAPVVAHGAVFLARRMGLVALDSQSGEVRWEQPVAGPLYGSPAVTDGAVIVAEAAGTIIAFSPGEGRRLWELSSGGLLVASPVFHEGVLYVATVGRKLLALDPKTGTLLWETDLERPVYRAPSVKGERLALIADMGTLQIVDLATGRVRFTSRESRALVQSAVLVDDVAVLAGRGRVLAMDVEAKTGWFDGQLRFWGFQWFAWGWRATPPAAKGLLWLRHFDPPAEIAGVAARDGAVYVSARDGRLFALDAASGETLWAQSASATVDTLLLAAPRYLYVGTRSGEVALFDRIDGTPAGSIQTGVPIDGSLTLAEGSLFVLSTTGSRLVALRP